MGPTAPTWSRLTIGGNDVMAEDMAPGQFEERLRRRPSPPCPAAPSSPQSLPSESCPRKAARRTCRTGIRAAVEDSDAHLVDLRSLTQEYSLPTYTFAYHAADFFHPNSAAYAKWAQLFAEAWATSRREAAPVVEDAPQWDMLSARVAQSEYDD